MNNTNGLICQTLCKTFCSTFQTNVDGAKPYKRNSCLIIKHKPNRDYLHVTEMFSSNNKYANSA